MLPLNRPCPCWWCLCSADGEVCRPQLNPLFTSDKLWIRFWKGDKNQVTRGGRGDDAGGSADARLGEGHQWSCLLFSLSCPNQTVIQQVRTRRCQWCPCRRWWGLGGMGRLWGEPVLTEMVLDVGLLILTVCCLSGSPRPNYRCQWGDSGTGGRKVV